MFKKEKKGITVSRVNLGVPSFSGEMHIEYDWKEHLQWSRKLVPGIGNYSDYSFQTSLGLLCLNGFK